MLVALRKESVDRNWSSVRLSRTGLRSLSARRAWIEIWAPAGAYHAHGSLSARRAWIEISIVRSTIAPSKESLSARRAWIEIDTSSTYFMFWWSLSARRAWIEIFHLFHIWK